MLIVLQTEQSLSQDLATILWLFLAMGFIINIPKCVTTPSRQVLFLGFTVDTSSMTVALPAAKVMGIKSEVLQVLQSPMVSLKTLSQLLGKLVATKPAVFVAPLHYRALQHLKISLMRSKQKTILISPEAQEELLWWHTQLALHSCSPFGQEEATIVIESDVSMLGWGAACGGVRTSGVWTLEEVQYHINVLELKAAFLAVQCFLKGKTAVNVLLRLDNQTAIAYLNHMGGPSLTPLCRLAIQMWEWCLARQIIIRAEYLPGQKTQ